MLTRRYIVAASVSLALLSVIGFSALGRDADSDNIGRQELVVFAATSLRDVFAQAGAAFQLENPGVEVTFSFGGSQELVSQLEHGALADIVATADSAYMDRLVAEGLVERLATFACNDPVLVVPASNPAGINQFADLPKAERIVLGTSAVPIGKYSEQILNNADKTMDRFAEQVLSKVVSRELTVRHVLAKVAMAEADAGIVYRTDAASSKHVRVIDIPSKVNVRAEYPLGLVKTSSQSELARSWNEFVTTGQGHTLLEAAGFGCLN